MEKIIGIALCGVFAVTALILGILQLCERGVPLNNAYLFASKEERLKMNKSPHFRQSGIVLLLCGGTLTMIDLSIVFNVSALLYLGFGLIGAALIYAIVSEIVIQKNPNEFSILEFFAKNIKFTSAHNIITAKVKK